MRQSHAPDIRYSAPVTRRLHATLQWWSIIYKIKHPKVTWQANQEFGHQFCKSVQTNCCVTYQTLITELTAPIWSQWSMLTSLAIYDRYFISINQGKMSISVDVLCWCFLGTLCCFALRSSPKLTELNGVWLFWKSLASARFLAKAICPVFKQWANRISPQKDGKEREYNKAYLPWSPEQETSTTMKHPEEGILECFLGFVFCLTRCTSQYHSARFNCAQVISSAVPMSHKNAHSISEIISSQDDNCCGNDVDICGQNTAHSGNEKNKLIASVPDWDW